MRAIKRFFVLCIAIAILSFSGCSGDQAATERDVSEIINENLEKTTTYRLHIAQPQTVGREMEFTANPAYMLHKSVI